MRSVSILIPWVSTCYTHNFHKLSTVSAASSGYTGPQLRSASWASPCACPPSRLRPHPTLGRSYAVQSPFGVSRIDPSVLQTKMWKNFTFCFYVGKFWINSTISEISKNPIAIEPSVCYNRVTLSTKLIVLSTVCEKNVDKTSFWESIVPNFVENPSQNTTEEA